MLLPYASIFDTLILAYYSLAGPLACSGSRLYLVLSGSFALKFLQAACRFKAVALSGVLKAVACSHIAKT